MFRRICIRARSANFYTHNTPSVLPKLMRQTLPFQSVEVLLVVGPAGCSKSPDFLPTQPRHAETRDAPSKAAATCHFIRGGWDDPNFAHLLTRPPTGTPRRAISPSEGSPRPRVAQATWTHRKHECLDVTGSFINPRRLFRKAVQQGRSE